MTPLPPPPTPAAPVRLRCPRCSVDMVPYERSGVAVDQCRECRGIFLDRGELERLVDAESGGTGWAGPRMVVPDPLPLRRASLGAGDGRSVARSIELRPHPRTSVLGERLDGQADR